jgi:hypothetical protein
MLVQRIDSLSGWRACTEVVTAIGTVPLVAVGPAGLFVIELDRCGGGVTLCDVPERRLMHAWAQAKHLERRRIGGPVTPVLAIDDGPTGSRRGVQVLPTEQVDAWLARQPAILDLSAVGLMLDRVREDEPLVLAG